MAQHKPSSRFMAAASTILAGTLVLSMARLQLGKNHGFEAIGRAAVTRTASRADRAPLTRIAPENHQEPSGTIQRKQLDRHGCRALRYVLTLNPPENRYFRLLFAEIPTDNAANH